MTAVTLTIAVLVLLYVIGLYERAGKINERLEAIIIGLETWSSLDAQDRAERRELREQMRAPDYPPHDPRSSG